MATRSMLSHFVALDADLLHDLAGYLAALGPPQRGSVATWSGRLSRPVGLHRPATEVYLDQERAAFDIHRSRQQISGDPSGADEHGAADRGDRFRGS